MPVAAKYTKILIDQFDFSGQSNQANLELAAAALDATAFEATAMVYVPGLPSGTFSHSGYYSGPGAGKLERELKARLGSDAATYLAFLFGTNQTACPAYVAPATWGQQLTLAMPFDGLVAVRGQWPAQRIQRGLRAYSGTLTAIGAQASIDLGAAGASGGQLYLFVQATNGANVTVAVEDSADNAIFAQVATAEIDAVGAQAVSLAGAIDRYVRINLTSLGLATSITLTAVVCVDGVTQ